MDDGQIDLSDGDYLVIGTLESYCYIRDYFGKENVVPLLIDVEARIRLERAMKREGKQENPRYDEMCRRFLADEEDFSEDKLKAAGVDTRFPNNDKIEDCIDSIKAFILDKKA